LPRFDGQELEILPPEEQIILGLMDMMSPAKSRSESSARSHTRSKSVSDTEGPAGGNTTVEELPEA
jgi:hypothetical protein